MRKTLRTGLVALALILGLMRIFTGIVYEYDDPTTYFVVKKVPSLMIVQTNRPETPVEKRFLVLDGDENELVYQTVYVAAMRWVVLEILVLIFMVWRVRPNAA
jgi:hypothetical protein